jgi:hypothetical protein
VFEEWVAAAIAVAAHSFLFSAVEGRTYKSSFCVKNKYVLLKEIRIEII